MDELQDYLNAMLPYHTTRCALRSIGYRKNSGFPLLRTFCGTHTPRDWKKRGSRRKLNNILWGTRRCT